jgi:GntR family negative regulator for fad regulon and positive regulator of fabA
MVENSLIRAMLEGALAPGSALPSERDLAARLGVARPTLREAMVRLGRDGWLSVRKGQPALVNDFWREGNLNTLADIARNTDHFSRDFIVHLLEIRAALAPAFIREAVRQSPARVVAVLADSTDLEDSPGAFAQFDWKLQKKLAELSGNPVYLLILNSFDAIYIEMAALYFSRPDNREASKKFYRQLLEASMASDAGEAGRITGEAMEESISLWGNGQRAGEAEDAVPDGRRD